MPFKIGTVAFMFVYRNSSLSNFVFSIFFSPFPDKIAQKPFTSGIYSGCKHSEIWNKESCSTFQTFETCL